MAILTWKQVLFGSVNHIFMKFLSIISIIRWHKFARSNFGNVHLKIAKLHGKIIYIYANLADRSRLRSW